MKRALGYARVSTEKQDLIRQEKLIMEFCDANDYLLIDIINEKVSGAKNAVDREGLMKLLSLNGSEADSIIVSELSRLSREDDTLDVLNKINSLLTKGFNVIFLDKPEKIYEANSKLTLVEIITLSVEAHHASEERKKIANRMKTGKYPKIQSNPYMYTGGTAPYGFEIIDNPEYIGQKNNIPAKRILTINAVEIENVKLIYNWILNGTTARDAAKKANELGLLTRKNKKFCQTSICKMIKNPIYNGRRRFKEFDLHTEKIISDAEWNLAQKKLNNNKIFKGHGKIHFNPLKGIIFCPCGYAMMLHQMGGKRDGAYLTYHCCVKHRPEYGHTCKNGGLKADILLDVVWKCVQGIIINQEYISKDNEEIRRIEYTIRSLEKNIADRRKRIVQMKNDMNRIPDIILSLTNIGNVNESLLASYNAKYSDYQHQIKEQEELIDNYLQEVSNNNQRIKDIRSTSILKDFDSFDEEAKADIYRRVLTRVVYYSIKHFSGFIVITFKNGIETIVMTTRLRQRVSVQLPFTFKFNPDNRTVLVPESGTKKRAINDFSLPETHYVEYSFDDLHDFLYEEEMRI